MLPGNSFPVRSHYVNRDKRSFIHSSICFLILACDLTCTECDGGVGTCNQCKDGLGNRDVCDGKSDTATYQRVDSVVN